MKLFIAVAETVYRRVMRSWQYFVIFLWMAYFVCLWPRMIVQDGAGIKAWGYAAWDWSAHFAYANVFAYQPIREWLAYHPLYYESKFVYPFFADLIAGIFVRAGVPYREAFLIPSLAVSLFLVVALYVFFRYVLQSSRQAALAVTLVLGGGGLGFMVFLQDIFRGGVSGFYTWIDKHDIVWPGIIFSELIPQRAFLLGIPVTLTILYLLRRWADTEFTGVPRFRLAFLGVASGILLVIHTHSFMALALAAFVLFLFSLKLWRTWLIYIFFAVLTSALIYFPLYSVHLAETAGKAFFLWRPMGYPHNHISFWGFLRFWAVSWGVFGVFAGLAFLKKEVRREPFAITGAVLFLVSNMLQFSPYMWDNKKLLLWSYIFLTIGVMRMLAELWRGVWVNRAAAAIAFALMIFSGMIDAVQLFWSDPHSNGLIISNKEIELAKEFQKISQPQDVVLFAPSRHNHWVQVYAGRRILMGYPDFLWTYGINYYMLESDINIMLSGHNDAETLLRKYKVAFVVVGNDGKYQIDEAFFSARYKIALARAGYRIYKVQ